MNVMIITWMVERGRGKGEGEGGGEEEGRGEGEGGARGGRGENAANFQGKCVAQVVMS